MTTPKAGNLQVRWIHGAPGRKQSTDPLIQVHAYDQDTYILRQSKTVTRKAPFMYLLFGRERALLLDTGATAGAAKHPLRTTVDELVGKWLAENPHEDYELVVAHTQGTGAHVAADGQFAGRPRTRIVGHGVAEVREFFGLPVWPEQTAEFELGDRAVTVIPCPGHEESAVSFYDQRTGTLFTGHTVFPGRLHAVDFPAFAASLDRLVAFALDPEHPVTFVLGGHIEMTREPGRDYAVDSRYQPKEPALQMTAGHLIAVRDAAKSVADRPGVHRFDDFIIYHGMSRGDQARLLAESLLHRVVHGRES